MEQQPEKPDGQSGRGEERWVERRGPVRDEEIRRVMRYEGEREGGDLIVEGQGRVADSNQLSATLCSSIWDSTSLYIRVCVCVFGVGGYDL